MALSNGATGGLKSKAAPRGVFTVNESSIDRPKDENGQAIIYQHQSYPKYIREADEGPSSDHIAKDAAHEAQIRARVAAKAEPIPDAVDESEPHEETPAPKKRGPKPKALVA